ncbi:MAG: patatin family protein [Spirochaetaceae bacterium]|nr:MAG: patatin family protein [Spirochaetaceae bacterium]
MLGIGKKVMGLALGGGAVRGFAHIGVLKALAEADIKPHYVAGTSVGSLIGALYCAGHSWSEIEEKAVRIEWKDLVKPTFPKLGVVKPDGLRDMIDELVEGRHIEDLEIPYAAVAVDLVSATEVVFESGPISTAVLASCSIPGIFVPVETEDAVLVDGGVLNAVPADVVKRMGAEYVVAVDLNADAQGSRERPDSILDVTARSMALFMNATASKGLSYADCVVQPDLKGFSYHDMSNREEMVRRGETAMKHALSKVQRRIK